MKPLPKWFNGDVYPKGGTVENMYLQANQQS